MFHIGQLVNDALIVNLLFSIGPDDCLLMNWFFG